MKPKMKPKQIEKDAKEVEQHLEELIKVKMMRILSEKMKSKKFTNKWQPLLQLMESVQPGTLAKLQNVLQDSLDKKEPR